jgi:(p)ppGpp synthase/HD superfamily hydrolase
MELSHAERIERARIYGTAAHAAIGQVRKYTGQPYIVHPAEVARLVATVPHIPEMIMAAWLHDVVEDTTVTIEDIAAEFGLVVAGYVDGLTNPARPEDGSRSVRFLINCAHLARQPREVQTIKLADIIANTSNIVAHDYEFASTYLSEKRRVLLLLTKGDETLTKLAWETVQQGFKQLEQTA